VAFSPDGRSEQEDLPLFPLDGPRIDAATAYAFDSRPINNALRSTSTDVIDDAALVAASIISAGMRPLPQPLRVYRAFNFRPQFRANDVARLVGFSMTDRGFMSTSPDPVAVGRFRYAGRIIAINVPVGTRVLYLRRELVPHRSDAGTTIGLDGTDRAGRLVATLVGQSRAASGLPFPAPPVSGAASPVRARDSYSTPG